MTIFGGFRTLWIITMFDLPTMTVADKRSYTRFRKSLQQDGFIMLQYSVYARHCASEENAAVHVQRVKQSLPDKGEVQIMTITDKQFSRIHVFRGKKREKTTTAPQQITLF